MRFAQPLAAAAMALLLAVANADEADNGRAAFQSGDYETALTIWQPLAEAGHADSQFGLGQMYGNGFGVAMDDALAIKWYSLAAEQGHAKAQFNLAVMHQNGWGLPQSDAESMKYYTLAADQGVTAAMVALGRFYSMDFLDSYDPILAFKWFKIAYDLHDMDAAPKLEAISGAMSAEQLAEGNAAVSAWKDEHAALMASHPN
jgi:uncharacterized protein